jgi:RimJ/RimL family protein N-acetyltransferase
LKIPKSIFTERLLLRCWNQDDADELLPILKNNIGHLKDWIPERVASPVPLPELKIRLAEFINNFESEKEFRYAIFSLDEKTLLGEVSLFPRSDTKRVNLKDADRVEIGYWLRSDITGRGYATEASKAMMDLSISILKMNRIEIRCDADNLPSAAIPKKLNFILAETKEDADPNKMVWYLEV